MDHPGDPPRPRRGLGRGWAPGHAVRARRLPHARRLDAGIARASCGLGPYGGPETATTCRGRSTPYTRRAPYSRTRGIARSSVGGMVVQLVAEIAQMGEKVPLTECFRRFRCRSRRPWAFVSGKPTRLQPRVPEPRDGRASPRTTCVTDRCGRCPGGRKEPLSRPLLGVRSWVLLPSAVHAAPTTYQIALFFPDPASPVAHVPWLGPP